MLYPKNTEKELTKELFANPTSEYRGAPFWAWNGDLDTNMLKEGIAVFEKMGFGGFHMHPRVGLGTEYLGDDYKSCVRFCTDEAKSKNMLAYLYDEDKWPSGFAGGYVTKEKKYRERYLKFTPKKSDKAPVLDENGKLLEGEKLLAKYKITFIFGMVYKYKRLAEGDNHGGKVYYAYLCVDKPSAWYNDQTYVDTLNKEAIDKFADVTYGAYSDCVGNEFGKTVPSIFTDEPQYMRAKPATFALLLKTAKMPWTDDFEETFQNTYGESLLDGLPEIIFDVVGKKYSNVRWKYYNHLTDRFRLAFSENLGAKCDALNLPLTGHLMQEPDLFSQTRSVGDAMRHYKGFGYPGIDMLCGRHEFTTAKQCQSVVRQLGKSAMTSELYGVSRWNAEFCRFKEEGDWQAALGVTIRVPHLTMYSMHGEAKRDYPPSFGYQSPWHEKYGIVENHFARVNTAMTRGKAVCDVALIHPVESFFMMMGSDVGSGMTYGKYNKKFLDITKGLLLNGIDFDFISEGLFAEECPNASAPLNVGSMSYKTAVIPNCITLRAGTVERLIDFAKAGGKLVIFGNVPTMINAKIDDNIKDLVSLATIIPDKLPLLYAELEEDRNVGIYKDAKAIDPEFIAQLRQDGEYEWLFIAHPDVTVENARVIHPYKVVKADRTIKIKGEWYVSEWDTLTGKVTDLLATRKDGFTDFLATFYYNDSKLYRLQKLPNNPKPVEVVAPADVVKIALPAEMSYTLDEPNVLLLDEPYCSLDGGAYSKNKKVAIWADDRLRKKLGLRKRSNQAQPWAMKGGSEKHTVGLKYVFESEVDVDNTFIALEGADTAEITFNGSEIANKVVGYYVDKSIGKIKLGKVNKGTNTLEVKIILDIFNGVESMYLLGNFGVKVSGSKCTVTALPEKLTFGDITTQGLPFYGGKLTYKLAFESRTVGTGKLSVPAYRSALLTLTTKSGEQDIAFAPYEAEFSVNHGRNFALLTAYISRRNAFGTIHSLLPERCMEDPGNFRPFPTYRTKSYVFVESGIIRAPEIVVVRK